FDAQQVEKPIAGDMSERLDRFDPVEKRERFFDIDMSRTQQLLSERAVQRGKSMGQVVFLVIEKSSSGERHSVAVDAIAGYSDDNVTGLDVVTDQNFVERQVADGRTGQINPSIMSRNCAVSPPEIEIPAASAPRQRPMAISSRTFASTCLMAM